jgi:hypothetical protein
MFYVLKTVSVRLLAVACAALALNASAADTPATEASEQTPGVEKQGATYDHGPRKYGDTSGGGKIKNERVRTEGHVEERTERHVEHRSSDATEGQVGDRYYKIDGQYVKIVEPKDAPGTTGGVKADPDKAAKDAARNQANAEKRIRAAIRRLGTGSWREAQQEIIEGGRTSVPLLIDAMAGAEETAVPAYNLGGHTKSDSGRATRNRTIAEVCSELLTRLVTQHSNYKGELPTLSQKEWQEWWLAHGDRVTFGK